MTMYDASKRLVGSSFISISFAGYLALLLTINFSRLARGSPIYHFLLFIIVYYSLIIGIKHSYWLNTSIAGHKSASQVFFRFTFLLLSDGGQFMLLLLPLQFMREDFQ